MPPEASSRPEIGRNLIDTSTSPYGPGGATMTLNSFFVARWTSTFLPLGASAMSSTAHWPSTVVHPSTPLALKSNLSTGTLSGTLSSSAAPAAETRDHPSTASAASVVSSILRRVTFMPGLPASTRDRSSIELFRHRLPLGALHQRHVGHWGAILNPRHHADDAISLVLLHRLGGRRIERALGLGHRLALCLGGGEVLGMGVWLRLGDLSGLGVQD